MTSWTRRDFLRAAGLGATAAALPSPASAMGGDDRFTIGLLLPHGKTEIPRPGATRRLLQEVEKRTSVAVMPNTRTMELSAQVFDYPMLILNGDAGFDPWPNAAIERLRAYLKAGGFLYVDSAEGVHNGPFITSVRRELSRIYTDVKPQPVPRDHVLFKSFYLLDEAYGRIEVTKTLDAIIEDDRAPVVLNMNDALGAWARDNFGAWEFDVIPGGSYQRERAFRLGINLVMYALCINYKADQVHIPFILRRRKWKVEP
ncbi:MAG: DUF4159 domain-containing protein [Myxococcota bacterium]